MPRLRVAIHVEYRGFEIGYRTGNPRMSNKTTRIIHLLQLGARRERVTMKEGIGRASFSITASGRSALVSAFRQVSGQYSGRGDRATEAAAAKAV